MFLDNPATFIHPAVEATSPELQDLVRSDSPISPDEYQSIDNVFEHFQVNRQCSLSVAQMNSLGVDFLCNDRGLYAIARCQGYAQGYARVPVGHNNFNMTAYLIADKSGENYNVRGINIIEMQKHG